jgi:hypothetical protein
VLNQQAKRACSVRAVSIRSGASNTRVATAVCPVPDARAGAGAPARPPPRARACALSSLFSLWALAFGFRASGFFLGLLLGVGSAGPGPWPWVPLVPRANARGHRHRHSSRHQQVRALRWPQGGLSFATALPPAHPSGGLVRAHKKPRRRTRARLALLADPGYIFFERSCGWHKTNCF